MVTGLYTARVREADLSPNDGVIFRQATLVENYNRADMLQLTGKAAELDTAAVPGNGLLLYDESGAERFSGQLTSIGESGDGSMSLIFAGDLVRMWWRICYPVTGNAWTTAGQNVAYDTINDDAETKLLSLINRNAGPSARTERKFLALRLPSTSGRGPAGVTSARFDTLGELVAALAESAGLRVRIVQTYDGWTPYLDVMIDEAPDLTATHRFGTARTAPLQVGSGWSTRIEVPIVTTALSAAGGTGNARVLTAATATDAETLWGARIEGLVDQSNTTDSTEIANGLADALANGAGPTAVTLPLPDNALTRSLPLGALVTAKLRKALFTDRIRQRTTVLGGDGATKQVSVVFGDPDAGLKTPIQRDLARERRRVQNLERR